MTDDVRTLERFCLLRILRGTNVVTEPTLTHNICAADSSDSSEKVSRRRIRRGTRRGSESRVRPGGFIGRTVGHYLVRELLGRGGMASVYLAEHRVLGREVALKILHARYAEEETMVNRFVNEARSMASIEHPGILAIQDIGQSRDGDFYTVMELLRGETLGERLDKLERISEARTLKLARQIACALGAAHDRGVIHRDIKPDNVFLVPDAEVPGGERVKVLDFGIAKVTGVVQNDLTAVGIVVGTPAYMAPEQCTPNAEVDGRADIYGLGGLMYRMVTGQKPFTSFDEYELLRSHLYATPESPIELEAPISSAFDQAIMRCLAKEPDERFQSMHELAECLSSLESVVEISGPMTAPYIQQLGPLPSAKTVPMNVPTETVAALQQELQNKPESHWLEHKVERFELTEVEIDVSDLREEEVVETAATAGPGIIWSH